VPMSHSSSQSWVTALRECTAVLEVLETSPRHGGIWGCMAGHWTPGQIRRVEEGWIQHQEGDGQDLPRAARKPRGRPEG
jgi:hypothetical protein